MKFTCHFAFVASTTKYNDLKHIDPLGMDVKIGSQLRFSSFRIDYKKVVGLKWH